MARCQMKPITSRNLSFCRRPATTGFGFARTLRASIANKFCRTRPTDPTTAGGQIVSGWMSVSFHQERRDRTRHPPSLLPVLGDVEPSSRWPFHLPSHPFSSCLEQLVAAAQRLFPGRLSSPCNATSLPTKQANSFPVGKPAAGSTAAMSLSG